MQRDESYGDALTLARRARLNKVVLRLAAKHVGRSEACVLKMKYRSRSNLAVDRRLHSFDVAARFKNRRSRSDTFLGCDQAFYWRRTPAALNALHGTTKTKFRFLSVRARALPPPSTEA